jgi:hypothetical protein
MQIVLSGVDSNILNTWMNIQDTCRKKKGEIINNYNMKYYRFSIATVKNKIKNKIKYRIPHCILKLPGDMRQTIYFFWP